MPILQRRCGFMPGQEELPASLYPCTELFAHKCGPFVVLGSFMSGIHMYNIALLNSFALQPWFCLHCYKRVYIHFELRNMVNGAFLACYAAQLASVLAKQSNLPSLLSSPILL